MLSPSHVPDNNRKPSSAQSQQWGWVLFVFTGIVIVLMLLIGVTEGLFY
jgi:hypothetical protein